MYLFSYVPTYLDDHSFSIRNCRFKLKFSSFSFGQKSLKSNYILHLIFLLHLFAWVTTTTPGEEIKLYAIRQAREIWKHKRRRELVFTDRHVSPL